MPYANRRHAIIDARPSKVLPNYFLKWQRSSDRWAKKGRGEVELINGKQKTD